MEVSGSLTLNLIVSNRAEIQSGGQNASAPSSVNITLAHCVSVLLWCVRAHIIRASILRGDRKYFWITIQFFNFSLRMQRRPDLSLICNPPFSLNLATMVRRGSKQLSDTCFLNSRMPLSVSLHGRPIFYIFLPLFPLSLNQLIILDKVGCFIL